MDRKAHSSEWVLIESLKEGRREEGRQDAVTFTGLAAGGEACGGLISECECDECCGVGRM